MGLATSYNLRSMVVRKGTATMTALGIAMVVVMLWKPRGFVGSREPTAFLHKRKAVSAAFTKEGHG